MRLHLFDYFSSEAAEAADRLAFPAIPVVSLLGTPGEASRQPEMPLVEKPTTPRAGAGRSTETPAFALVPSGAMDVQEVVDRIVRALPELMAVAVADSETGISLASSSRNPEFDADTAAAYHAEVLRQQRNAMQALRMDDDQAEEVLVTAESNLHLLQLVPDKNLFLYLAVDLRRTNLAIARKTAKDHLQFL